MTVRFLTHDDVTGGCSLRELTPYPALASSDASVDITTITAADGSKTYNLAAAGAPAATPSQFTQADATGVITHTAGDGTVRTADVIGAAANNLLTTGANGGNELLLNDVCGDPIPAGTNMVKSGDYNPVFVRTNSGPTLSIDRAALPASPSPEIVLANEDNFLTVTNPYCGTLIGTISAGGRVAINFDNINRGQAWNFGLFVTSEVYRMDTGATVFTEITTYIDGTATSLVSQEHEQNTLVGYLAGQTVSYGRRVTYRNTHTDPALVPFQIIYNLPGAVFFGTPVY